MAVSESATGWKPEWVCKVVTLQEAGRLADLLGEDLLTVDSLVVKGPINDDDFTAMWKASTSGELEALNLGEATVESGKVPEKAFCRPEQFVWSGDTLLVTLVVLKNVILPEGVTEIGPSAFAQVVGLKEISLPGSLREIGRSGFSYCRSLSFESTGLPEGLESIGGHCFEGCVSLDGTLKTPSTLKHIGQNAFYDSSLTTLELNEGLENIDEYAFLSCNLQGEVVIPNSCQLNEGIFSGNVRLERVVLPSDLEHIPPCLFSGCFELREADIPESVKVIGKEAFNRCLNLREVNLPEGLDSIKSQAFAGCRHIRTLILPSTLQWIGSGAFEIWNDLQDIYCKAVIPPTLEGGALEEGGVFAGVPAPVTVYIPVGTRDVYMWAEGWMAFSIFVELDQFPDSGVTAIPDVPRPVGDGRIYDLNGRLVVSPVPGQLYIRDGVKILHR